ncbi:ankyrin [Corynespora cassiicola Philippines]|uniref:pH-response transcription factor pacC/RIM101 n=1 Tax=Corynespora cassiicola Philippines TaxID=1448308 RepID=A0A2T2P1W4_CORCC|nr:ankyrin [Corynespora cassiicola Philippines]
MNQTPPFQGEQFLCGFENCRKVSASRKAFTRHKNTHLKPFECQECGKGFALRSDLNRHVKARHRIGNEKYPCNVLGCNFKAARKDFIKPHMKTIHRISHGIGSEVVRIDTMKDSKRREHLDGAIGQNQAKKVEKNLPREHPGIHKLDVPCLNGGKKKGYPTILRAAEAGNLELVQRLIDSGSEVSAKGDDESTALHCAAKSGHIQVVEYLLDQGAKINERNEKGRTPLEEAIFGKRYQALEMILENTCPNPDRRFFKIIGQAGDEHILSILAIYQNQDFLKTGAKIMLHSAVKSGNEHLAKHLLSIGDDELYISNGMTLALHAAAKRGNEQIINLILAHKNAPVNRATTYSTTPLKTAICHNQQSAAKILLQHEKTDVHPIDFSDKTLLSLALENNQPEIARLIFSHTNFNINSKMGGGNLRAFASDGNIEWVKMCLSHKDIDVNMRSYCADPALNEAAKNGHIDILKLLLDRPEIDLDKRGFGGEIALHVAARNGHYDIVKALLSHPNIDINAISKPNTWNIGDKEWTALDLAKENGHETMTDLLLAHGALSIADLQAMGDGAIEETGQAQNSQPKAAQNLSSVMDPSYMLNEDGNPGMDDDGGEVDKELLEDFNIDDFLDL